MRTSQPSFSSTISACSIRPTAISAGSSSWTSAIRSFPQQVADHARHVLHRVVVGRAVIVADDAVLVGYGELGAVQEWLVAGLGVAAGGELEAVDRQVDDGLALAGEEAPARIVAHARGVIA